MSLNEPGGLSKKKISMWSRYVPIFPLINSILGHIFKNIQDGLSKVFYITIHRQHDLTSDTSLLCISSYHPIIPPPFLPPYSRVTPSVPTVCFNLFAAICLCSHCSHYLKHLLSLIGIIFVRFNFIHPSRYSSIVGFRISHSKLSLFSIILTTFCVI